MLERSGIVKHELGMKKAARERPNPMNGRRLTTLVGRAILPACSSGAFGDFGALFRAESSSARLPAFEPPTTAKGHGSGVLSAFRGAVRLANGAGHDRGRELVGVEFSTT